MLTTTSPKPNWSAVAALFRAMTMIAALAFVGAVVLPVGADGTLPITWAAWKPILALGFSAAAVAEFIWIRSHLRELAQSWGIVPPTSTTTTTVTDGSAVAKVEQRGAAPFRLVLGLAVAGVLAALLTGCITSSPIVPVTPTNSAQISACQGTATLHNGFVIGDFALGGASAGLASAAVAVTDTQTKTTLGVIGAGVAGGLVLGTAIAELTASNFTNSQCSNVVGSLPTSPAPSAPPAEAPAPAAPPAGH